MRTAVCDASRRGTGRGSRRLARWAAVAALVAAAGALDLAKAAEEVEADTEAAPRRLLLREREERLAPAAGNPFALQLSLDYYDFTATYDGDDAARGLRQNGDLSGTMLGLTATGTWYARDAMPFSLALTVRRGEFSGDVETTGATVPYTVAATTTRTELELRAGWIHAIAGGNFRLLYNTGYLYMRADTDQEYPPDFGPPATLSYANQTHFLFGGAGLGARTELGPVWLGARIEANLLAGYATPDYGSNAFVYGYNAKLTGDADYAFMLFEQRASAFLELGYLQQDYFGQDAAAPDASHLAGMYGRLGLRVFLR